MNKTALGLLGQLLNDAGMITAVTCRFLWAVAKKICDVLCRVLLLGVPVIIVAVLSLIVVWFAVGCAPMAYMGYKATQDDTHVDAKTQHSINVINTLRRNGCVPVLYAEKLSEFEDNRNIGCEMK